MKTKLLFTFIACLLSGALFAQVPTPVASFPFDADFLDAEETVTSAVVGDVVIAEDATRSMCAWFPGGVYADNHCLTIGINAYAFEAVTYNVWFRCEGNPLMWSRILTFGTDGELNTAPEFFITPSNGRLQTRIGLTVDAGTDDPGKEVPGDTILADTWYMVTAAQNATNLKLWLNGEVMGDSVHTADAPINLTITNGWMSQTPGWTDPLFHGFMDNFKIFDKVLTDEEVTALYNDEYIEPSSIKTNYNSLNLIVFSSGNEIKIINKANALLNAVQVYNLTGELVYQTNDVTGVIRHNFPPSLYFVKVQTSLGDHLTKLLIE